MSLLVFPLKKTLMFVSDFWCQSHFEFQLTLVLSICDLLAELGPHNLTSTNGLLNGASDENFHHVDFHFLHAIPAKCPDYPELLILWNCPPSLNMQIFKSSPANMRSLLLLLLLLPTATLTDGPNRVRRTNPVIRDIDPYGNPPKPHDITAASWAGNFHPSIPNPVGDGLIPAPGDVLNRTRCFCHRPDTLQKMYGVDEADRDIYGTFYRFDYFNVRLGITYSVTWTCDGKGQGLYGCEPVRHDGWRYDTFGPARGCMSASVGADDKSHSFCYTAAREEEWIDVYSFDKLKKCLPYSGRSRVGDQKAVDDACQPICMDLVGNMATLPGEDGRSMGNVMDTYEDLDDM